MLPLSDTAALSRSRTDTPLPPEPADFSADVAAIAGIEAVTTILDVVCRTTGMGFAAVARVTDTHWIACRVRDEIGFGLKAGGELALETTICNEIRDHRAPVVIDCVSEDEAFRHHATPALYGFQSYLSVPIVLPDGEMFGTLCAIDPRPAQLNNPATIGMFTLFAGLIAFHLDAHRRLAASQATLTSERETAVLREQFIAVLGHDLRNPLAAIAAGATLLERSSLDDKAGMILGRMKSSIGRMSELISDVMDFARGRLGDGVALRRRAVSLGPILDHVVAELRVANPDRAIETAFSLPMPIACDPDRIGQLLSNLLANALTHGASDKPVQVEAACRDGFLELAVINRGEPIPSATIEHLFKPFVRASATPSQQGLGLGLYITSEIARAHGGALDVVSTPSATRFSFRMPL